jgi:hypothetical protein
VGTRAVRTFHSLAGPRHASPFPCSLSSFAAHSPFSVSVPTPPDPHTHSLQIPLPPLDTKLAAFRQTLSEHTHLAPDAFKLIYAGAVMKDDDVPCESPLPTSGLPLRSPLDSVMFLHPSISFSFRVNRLRSLLGISQPSPAG